MSKKLKPYIPLVISLLAGLVLFFLVDNFLVTIMILPLMRLVWFISLVVKSLSQAAIWIGFVLIMLLITLKTVGKGVKTARTTRRTPVPHTRTVENWSRLLENARQSRYSKWRLAQELKRLTLNLLPPEDEEERKKYDITGLELPAEIKAYFEAHHPFNDSFMERFHLRNQQTKEPLDLDPEVVFQHLKERLNL